jgi:predicted RNase H-like HicB family nuclease
MEWKRAKRQLLEEGFLEFWDFRIELTLDNTFLDLDYIPRIVVYWEGDGRWHVMRNPIPKGRTLEESWQNAVKVLEMILKGYIEPDLGDELVSRKFALALRKTFGINGETAI